MSDTRKDRRTPLSLKVRFKSATLDEFVEQYSNDISRGGLFIKSKKPMKVGTLLKFEFQLKDESPLIHGVGRVVWSRDPEQGTGTAGMGIKFIKMDPESRAFVQKIVEERADAPGTFDEGESPKPKEDAFFPGGEAEQPDPEDRTQVRHASEFLAEALSDSDGAAEEAQANADAARKRTEEIQAERDAAEEARKKAEAEAAQELADKKRREREAAAAAEAAESEAEDESDESAEGADEDAKDDDAKLGVAATMLALDEKPAIATPKGDANTGKDGAKAKPKPAAPRPPSERAATPAAPEPESGNGMLFAIIGILVLGGGYFWWSSQQGEETVVEDVVEDDVNVEDVEEPTTATASIESNLEATILVDGVEVGTTPVDYEFPIGTEVIVTARVEGQTDLSRAIEANGEFTEPLTFEFDDAAEAADAGVTPSEYVLRVITTPSTADVRIDGTAAADGERRWDEQPGRIQIVATAPGFRSGNETVTGEDFEQDGDTWVRQIEISLSPRPVDPPTMRPRMVEPAMDTATMEPATMEPATMEPATMEPATMEPATMEPATMEPATMEPATMEPATMEPATMEPTMAAVPDNPF